MQVALAIGRSTFAREEEKEGFNEKPENAERFFREGSAGQMEVGFSFGSRSSGS